MTSNHVTSTCVYSRDRPSAIQVQVKHMADTSNFDDFEEIEEGKKRMWYPIKGNELHVYKLLVFTQLLYLTIDSHILKYFLFFLRL